METETIQKDITVFYIPATSFPEGILAAHQKLHSMVPFSIDRKYFGVSRPEDGKIQYKAAAEELQPGEAAKYHCETLVLRKGKYSSVLVKNYARDPDSIQNTFQQLLELPGLDPRGYCVEWYTSQTDVKCMIRMEQ